MENGSASELRPMFCELGAITRADGSCIFSVGDTTVACAVYGPGEVKPNREIIDKASVEIVYRSRVGMPGVADKKSELFLEKTCEAGILAALHPRTAITVNLQEMQDSGGIVSSCVNSACLSLLDAGAPMKFLFASVTCAMLKDGTVVLDPSLKELKSSSSQLVFVFESRTQSVISTHSLGPVSQIKLQECILVAKTAVAKIFQFYRIVIGKKFSKEL